MGKLFILVTTIILLISSKVTMANNPYSKVAANLQFVIQPKHEDESGYLKTQEVCECVAKKIYKNWTKDQFNNFEKELNEYTNKTSEALKDLNNILSGKLPQQTESLNKSLKNTIEFVESCEIEIGTEVEF